MGNFCCLTFADALLGVDCDADERFLLARSAGTRPVIVSNKSNPSINPAYFQCRLLEQNEL